MHLVRSHLSAMQEITRRVNLQGIWQAAYTAGVVLPKPIATCQYWHRSLNPKKLISINFSRLAVRSESCCNRAHDLSRLLSAEEHKLL